MRPWSLVSALACTVTLALALPSRRADHVVHEKRAFDPVDDWVKTRKLEAEKVLPMRFGLAQQNLHRVEEMLMAVSHPSSPTYGRHFSAAEVVDTFAPSDDTIAAVTNWLTEAGLHRDRLRLSASKGWISVNATVAEIEDLLDTEYQVYTHSSGAEQISMSFVHLIPDQNSSCIRLSFVFSSFTY